MSARAFYTKRFSTAAIDINDAAAAIDIAHTDVMRLLDLIIDVSDTAHFDHDHLYAAARAAMARLAEVDADLEAVSSFCAKARLAERDPETRGEAGGSAERGRPAGTDARHERADALRGPLHDIADALADAVA